MPEMHLFVGDKLKSIGRRAHSGRDFNDADANTVDLHQVEREKAMEVRVIATLQAKAGFEAAVSEAVHDIIEPSRQSWATCSMICIAIWKTGCLRVL